MKIAFRMFTVHRVLCRFKRSVSLRLLSLRVLTCTRYLILIFVIMPLLPLNMSEHNFPPLQNDRLLKALRGEPVDKVPVWIMRQAGRYLPEFRELRAKYDFFTICQTPQLACEVTLQPLKRFPLDACIIFSDILVIPQSMGLVIEMKPNIGPVIPFPLEEPSHIQRLRMPEVEKELGYVAEAIMMTRHKLEGKVPLVGFTGAPWTLMSYMVQGGGSSTMVKARSWLYKYPNESRRLLMLITDVIVDYLIMQVRAGVQAIQVFESHGDFLNNELFEEYSLRYFKQINYRVNEILDSIGVARVPMIAFPKGATLEQIEVLARDGGYDAISLDWTVDPEEARRRVGPNITLQGNMDPCALYATPEKIRQRAETIARQFGKQRYIANLGHGILPDIPIPAVEAFIEAVHSV